MSVSLTHLTDKDAQQTRLEANKLFYYYGFLRPESDKIFPSCEGKNLRKPVEPVVLPDKAKGGILFFVGDILSDSSWSDLKLFQARKSVTVKECKSEGA